MKNKIVLCCALTMMVSLSACSQKEEDKINVFRTEQLMNAGQISDRYVGMVVSENTIKIQKDYSKNVDELLVEEGQKISEGDTLFIYDTRDLDIQLDRNQLELNKSYALLENYQNDIAEYKQELEVETDETIKNQLEIKIKEVESNILGLGYTIEGQEREYNKTLEDLNNIKVKAPVGGTIKKIDESGQGDAYITIQQDGAYKVKGTINEMNMGVGITEGTRVKVISRIDANQTWFGEVKALDLQGNGQENNMIYGSNDPMSQSTSYAFYVELDNTDNLLLGQHVYIELVIGEEKQGLWIPNYFVTNESEDKAEVWVANSNDKLEKRTVTLGLKDENNGTIQIKEGLSNDDYIADPRNNPESGIKVEYHDASDFEIEEDKQEMINPEIEVETPLETETDTESVENNDGE